MSKLAKNENTEIVFFRIALLWIPLQQRILAAPTVCKETHHLLMPVFKKAF